MSDAEHELLMAHTAQAEELSRVRALALRAALAAIDAQDRADGRHDAWLDDVRRELEATREIPSNRLDVIGGSS